MTFPCRTQPGNVWLNTGPRQSEYLNLRETISDQLFGAISSFGCAFSKFNCLKFFRNGQDFDKTSIFTLCVGKSKPVMVFTLRMWILYYFESYSYSATLESFCSLNWLFVHWIVNISIEPSRPNSSTRPLSIKEIVDASSSKAK